MNSLDDNPRQIDPDSQQGFFIPRSADEADAWERRADQASLDAAQAAIAAGHRPATADIPDGTVVTSHVNAIFTGELPPRLIVIRRPDRQLGLHRRREVSSGIPSTHILHLDRLAMYTIDPADLPVNVIAERRAHEDQAGDRLEFDNRPPRHDGGET